MLKKLLARLRAWQDVRRAQRERAGFDWAAGELLSGVPAMQVEDRVAQSVYFDGYDHDSRAFDEGALRALQAWAAVRGGA